MPRPGRDPARNRAATNATRDHRRFPIAFVAAGDRGAVPNRICCCRRPGSGKGLRRGAKPGGGRPPKSRHPEVQVESQVCPVCYATGFGDSSATEFDPMKSVRGTRKVERAPSRIGTVTDDERRFSVAATSRSCSTTATSACPRRSAAPTGERCSTAHAGERCSAAPTGPRRSAAPAAPRRSAAPAGTGDPSHTDSPDSPDSRRSAAGASATACSSATCRALGPEPRPNGGSVQRRHRDRDDPCWIK